MSIEPTTNIRDSLGVDLGQKLITKDYLISVYPSIGEKIGIPPELWTWGNGLYGRLGNNSSAYEFTPVTTSAGGTNWKQVSSGDGHTAAIKTDGTLWVWGWNGEGGNPINEGQLGTNDGVDRLTPVTTFAGGTNWKQVSAGGNHTAAIKTDGTLWTWGFGLEGQLGKNSNTKSRTPVTTFAGGTNWKQVSANGSHCAAIKTDGTLWTWGRGEFGRLGTNDENNRPTPVTTFAGGTNWKQVSSGGYHTAAIKTDGTLWTWGANTIFVTIPLGSLGNDSTINTFTPVTTFAGGTNWKQVSLGAHTAAIKTDGTLWVWGAGGQGRLGTDIDSAGLIVLTPVTTFAGGSNWKQVSANGGHTAAIKTDGTLWVWGNGEGAQLGNNEYGEVFIPITTFAGGTNWKQVSIGGERTAAIQSVDFAGF